MHFFFAALQFLVSHTLFSSLFLLIGYFSCFSFSDSFVYPSSINLIESLFNTLLFSCPSLTFSALFYFAALYLNPSFKEEDHTALFTACSGVVQIEIDQRKKMNHCAIQQNSFAACEKEMSSSVAVSVSISDMRDTLVCPKPRRLSLISSTVNDPLRPLRWHMSHQQELCDSKAGNELLDIILAKGGYGVEQPNAQAASSPPFFSGSPPSRVSNPLIQDARFGDDKVSPVSPHSIPIPSGLSPSPSSSTRKGGCVRVNFGNKPAVRIEGFDCLDRDRRNCSIPALA